MIRAQLWLIAMCSCIAVVMLNLAGSAEALQAMVLAVTASGALFVHIVGDHPVGVAVESEMAWSGAFVLLLLLACAVPVGGTGLVGGLVGGSLAVIAATVRYCRACRAARASVR